MMHHLDGRLSAEDAYQVMMAFLQAYGERGGGEDTLVDVLSGAMSYLWEDGTPNDPAMWGDWVAAFGQARPLARGSSDAEVTHGEPNATIALTLGEAYRTMTTFLDSLYELRGGDLPLVHVMDLLGSAAVGEPPNRQSPEWRDWLEKAHATLAESDRARSEGDVLGKWPYC
ncbi:hypothetical protein [Stenotrophomonas sp. VV52]|uniref:hypothetical protein n=1 Tax=Stenotrophomonas sp. VV52 TaxID=2066958 RepID=UPI0011AF2429|nr:hypothetical protein [Stenotrophomonas sp. VV52]